tara:strand:- start:392 stop:613 length:222 start_codon:yes stop_codon:yes gene_type:complete
MYKHSFYAGSSTSKEFEIKNSKNIQTRKYVKSVDINKLLNRVKINEKIKKKKDLKLIGISLLMISSFVFFTFQ